VAIFSRSSAKAVILSLPVELALFKLRGPPGHDALRQSFRIVLEIFKKMAMKRLQIRSTRREYLKNVPELLKHSTQSEKNPLNTPSPPILRLSISAVNHNYPI